MLFARWDGHLVQYNTTTKQECTAQELRALNTAMWSVMAELKSLLAPGAPLELKRPTGLTELTRFPRSISVQKALGKQPALSWSTPDQENSFTVLQIQSVDFELS